MIIPPEASGGLPGAGTGINLKALATSREVRFIGLLLVIAVLAGYNSKVAAMFAALCVLAGLAGLSRQGVLK